VSILRELADVMISSAALARLAQPDMAEVITADEGALDARVSCVAAGRLGQAHGDSLADACDVA